MPIELDTTQPTPNRELAAAEIEAALEILTTQEASQRSTPLQIYAAEKIVRRALAETFKHLFSDEEDVLLMTILAPGVDAIQRDNLTNTEGAKRLREKIAQDYIARNGGKTFTAELTGHNSTNHSIEKGKNS